MCAVPQMHKGRTIEIGCPLFTKNHVKNENYHTHMWTIPIKNGAMLVDPKDGPRHILLDPEGTCWVDLDVLPQHLWFDEDQFDALFAMHPEERGKVIMKQNESPVELTTRRWHQSYLKTPLYDPQAHVRSFMFHGLDAQAQPALPAAFDAVLQYTNGVSGCNFNQVVANWYADGTDFIPFHSDYNYGKEMGQVVQVVNFVKSEEVCRTFVLKPKLAANLTSENTYIVLRQGCTITMGGLTQEKFTHGVPKQRNAPPRISLTFRTF